MRGPYDDHPEGRGHATVQVALARVLEMVREAGIPGFEDDEKFDECVQKMSTLHFRWRQGWSITQQFEVGMAVELHMTAPGAGEKLRRGLCGFAVRMKWPYDGQGSLATRTAVLDLATQVNKLSARIESELDGWFIIDESTYDEYQREAAEKKAGEDRKRKERQAEEAAKKKGRRRK